VERKKQKIHQETRTTRKETEEKEMIQSYYERIREERTKEKKLKKS
jgi:ribosome-binding protein aMBF1 (putative translation factor)